MNTNLRPVPGRNDLVINHCLICDQDFTHTKPDGVWQFDGWDRPYCFTCLLKKNTKPNA